MILTSLVVSIFCNETDEYAEHLQAEEISRVMTSAFWVVHPAYCAGVFWWKRDCSHPFIELCSDFSYFAVESRSVVQGTRKDVFVDTVHSMVDLGLYFP